MSSANESTGLRTFSGDTEDAKEYKRWRTWVTNKILTLGDKVPDNAKGAYVYTLLAGKALECVEHLEQSAYQKAGGEKIIFELLDQRFPQKDQSDEMSEALTEVFQLRAHEGESLKAWVSRATELFDRVKRKVNVAFPEEARGWIILHRAGLTEEQKAVILSRSLGVLKREEIGRAMRSCYPELIIGKKRASAAIAIVDEEDEPPSTWDEADATLADMEQFLAEHQQDVPVDPDEIFDEQEVAEALAVSWRERRKEMVSLKRARKFTHAGDSKRSFKVEIEEMKRRTRCNRCGQVGHWARDCKQPKGSGKSVKGPPTSSSSGYVSGKGGESGAAFVEDFVAMVESQSSWLSLQLLRERREVHKTVNTAPVSSPTLNIEQLLVSSPGYGVLDSGCGRSIVGALTLKEFEPLWQARGWTIPVPFAQTNHLKFGNGQKETTQLSVRVPVQLGGRPGTIKAAIVQGSAPLLISRNALRTLKAVIDFSASELIIFDERVKVPLLTNQAGQFTVDLLGEQDVALEPFAEVMTLQTSLKPDEHVPLPDEPVDQSSSHSVEPASHSQDLASGSEGLHVWKREDHFLSHVPSLGKQGPLWSSIRRRVVTDLDTNTILFDECINPQEGKSKYNHPLPKHVMHTRTEFWFTPQELSLAVETLPVHQLRQLESQVRSASCSQMSDLEGKPFLVAEVFSPPRCAPVAEQLGFAARSYDLKTGYDFRRKSDRDQVFLELQQTPPELLVLCPPCTDEGGWFNLNSLHMSTVERAHRIAQSRMYIKFCVQLYEQQVSLGKKALIEHPHGSRLWNYPEIRKLSQSGHLLKCHMCRFGLRLPGSDKLIRKTTRLLVSDETMSSLARECPGHQHPKHQCHQTIAGSAPGVGSISTFAGVYTPQFVNAVLETIPAFKQCAAASVVECDLSSEPACQEVLVSKADLDDAHASDSQLLQVLDKLHRNLGHPPGHDMIRILKHAQASERAIALARKHECDLCKKHMRPHAALPAKTSRVSEFNHTVGIDVKFLPGWKTNQKVKALNIVCHGSCYQLVLPFHETETSSVIRKLFAENWVRVFGPPRVILIDQAQTNMGEALQNFLDLQGTEVKQIPGEAHWQLGRTENHGGWFARILSKVISEHCPENVLQWEECVIHAHVKNSMIQYYGHTPHQHVFGQNPRVPSDLLDEPLSVIPATASLSDEQMAKAQAIRSSARRAVIEMQDSNSLRRALFARPRIDLQFAPGDLVAYWRNQKFQAGQGVVTGGKWFGIAVVIGSIGRNYIVAHRRQVFRVAPEQMRPATSEEKATVLTPQAELLGIKDLIEGGTFRSHNFIDLVPGHYPPSQPSPDPPDANMPGQEPNSAEIPQILPENPSRTDSHDKPTTPEPPVAAEIKTDTVPDEGNHPLISDEDRPDKSWLEPSYGLVRTKHGLDCKSQPSRLYRPPQMSQDDFVEIMRELVPQLIEQTVHPSSSEASSASGVKRSADSPPSPTSEPPAQKPRIDEHLLVESGTCQEVLSVQDCHELCHVWQTSQNIEVLVAAYLQKRAAKEIPASGNEPILQELVDESKLVEWNTLLEKRAIRVHTGKHAQWLKENRADRFMGSRFVIVRKPLEENLHLNVNDPATYRVKSRWCLQGHLDPDLEHEGLLQSPTLSQIGRMILMQLISSFQWDLQLGDIKGAFLEAGPLPERFRPLYARLPAGGIPSVPDDAVLEITGNVYGQNDAPAAWHKAFDAAAIEFGWERSLFDACLYFLRDTSGKLCGAMGVHVDDTALGGHGSYFDETVKRLKERFPYRKWRIQSGEFCGAFYTQDPQSKSISMSQQTFAENIRPAHIAKGANNEQGLQDSQVRVLRAINGSLNWIASQSRPDLAVQTSLSQQAFLHPQIRHLREVNNAVRRAKQHKDVKIQFRAIPPENLRLCCHSDAAFANVGSHTQAGYVIAFVDQKLDKGEVSPWTPMTWKSYKLPRAVSSTLAGESQALSTATGTVEWACLILSEALDGKFEPRLSRQRLGLRPPILATDCKSLYDHLTSPSSPTAVDDRRTSIDIVIIRESTKATHASIRWLPTNRMLADALTKDKMDPVDLLRSCLRSATYQISPEEHVLAQQAKERELRLLRRNQSTKEKKPLREQADSIENLEC